MIEWFILGVSFFSLYLGIFWLHIVSLKDSAPIPELKELPFVSVIVPARNEEKTLWKTGHSLVSLDYPREKLEIIFVDHGSTDSTAAIVEKLIRYYPTQHIRLIQHPHAKGDMKAHAFNEGLRHARGTFVACVDADTLVLKDALLQMLPHFHNKNVGAVISTIKVHQPKNIYERIQHLEYIFATFIRGLMSKIDTLHVTPGALSIYQKELLDRLGGFDEHNLTEDLEMAMRLRSLGYIIKHARGSVTYTKVPDTFRKHWEQRVRWFRGFIFNSFKYKGMLFNRKYALLGTFQYPINFITMGVILLMFFLMGYTFLTEVYRQIVKFLSLGFDAFLFNFKDLPTFKQVFLSINIPLAFVIIISFTISTLIYHLAHKNLKEKWRYPLALVTYLTVYPLLRFFHWMTAFSKEFFRSKHKWK